MAELIECDKCGTQVAGRIKDAVYNLQGMQVGTSATTQHGGPTVPGWVEIRGKLLCPLCDGRLNEFLKEVDE